MANVARGNRSRTAWASTWAVEWRIVNRPRSDSAVTIATASPSSSGHTRSRSTPLTSAITAASPSRRPMDDASSPAVVPGATWRAEPSGSVIVMSAISRA